MEKAILKRIPSDFRVTERITLPNDCPGQRYQYLKLIKSGFSTFQAVEILADHFGIKDQEIQFAGLKDENGITEQFISVAKGVVTPVLANTFNHKYASLGESQKLFIRIEFYSFGDKPISIGALDGNDFDLTIRCLSHAFISRIDTQREYEITFLNYYGHQRFGLPNQVKNNHLIGKELACGSINKAIDIIASSIDCGFPDNNKKAIKSLLTTNIRRRIFYVNAYYSHLFNLELKKEVIKFFSNAIYPYSSEDIDYFFLENGFYDEKFPKSLPYTAIRIDENGHVITKTLIRPVLVDVKVRFTDAQEDDIYPEKYKTNCTFYLPKGCYATVFVPQALRFIK